MMARTDRQLVLALVLACAACSKKSAPEPAPTDEVTTTGAEVDVSRAVEAILQARLARAGFSGVRVEVYDGAVTVRGGVEHDRHDEALRLVRELTPDDVRVYDETDVTGPVQ